MIQGSYTAEAWTAMVKKPQNRLEVVRNSIEKMGGKLIGGWFAFGEYDVVLICEMPESVSAAAFAVAGAAGGALKAIKTTPLLTAEEAQEVMKRATKTGYRPPG